MNKFIDVCGVPFLYKEFEPNSRSDNSMGRSDSAQAIIHINKDMPKEMKETVIIHEWLHAVFDCNGFGELSSNEVLVSMLQNELYRAGFRCITFRKRKVVLERGFSFLLLLYVHHSCSTCCLMVYFQVHCFLESCLL